MWRKARVLVDAIGSDAIQGALLDLDALGLEIEDDETRAVPGKPFTPTHRATVFATFSRRDNLERDVTSALGLLAENVGFQFEIDWSDLEPRDWNEEFKASWQPLELCARVWIAPSWSRDFVAPEGAKTLWMDPGMAFGTGTHATTQLCSRALDDHLRAHKIPRLLDVGTGTGVLSFVALMLGATEARGTDIEDAAVRAALMNADENGLAKRFTADADAPDRDGPVWDAAVANILAGPLMGLAPSIAAALKPGAPLWLSGLLEDQLPGIRDAYLPAGFEELGTEVQDGWVRVDLRKT
jgi:ribosomal protein L11 methyltransferase